MSPDRQFRLELACIVSSLPYRRSFFQRGGFRSLGSNLERWSQHLERIFGIHRIRNGLEAFRELLQDPDFKTWSAYISVHFVTEASYPSTLLHIFDPPGVIWVRYPEKIHSVNSHPDRSNGPSQDKYPVEANSRNANSQAMNLVSSAAIPWQRNAIAVIGTRNPEPVSVIATERFVKWAGQSSNIVSGLALGIDAVAHRSALAMGGLTMAVLGAGVLRPGPAENSPIWKRPGAGQIYLLSEFLPNTPARSYHFPRRNRIIAGLAGTIALMQAPKKSGALISAAFALEEGRDLLVFDHPLLQKPGANEGGRDLLQQGAMDMNSLMEILPERNLHTRPSGPVNTEYEIWLRKSYSEGKLRSLGQGWLFYED
ncbi:MAG: DNA-processing protein DprA [Leptospiraceae bacterium]